MFKHPAVMLLLVLPFAAAASNAPQRVDAARVVAAARAALDRQLAGDSAHAHVAVVGTPEDIMVMPGRLALKARHSAGRWPRARVSVPVDISVDGKVVRSATVWFALSVQRHVLGYASDAAAGTLPASLKFVPQDADVAALQSPTVADPRDLDGKRLRHSVLAGAPVMADDFEKIPDVDRRGRVDVIASFGLVRMQAKGISASAGNVGDTVSVLVDGAEAPVRALVTAKGVVDVVE